MLLILAGITINALTGSDSAPAKANEAEQKNDIGSAKDQIGLTAINAKTEAYDAAYVGTGISSTEASNSVGRAVIEAVEEKYTTDNKIGNAIISVDVPKTNNVVSGDAIVTIWTNDFSVDGTITLNDGILTWDNISSNIPQITGIPKNLILAPGDITILVAKLKGTTGNILWNSNKPNVATVENGVVTVLEDAEDKAEVEISVLCENISATCTIKIEKPKSIGEPINADKYGYKVKRAKYENGQIVRNSENNIVYENYKTPAETTYTKGWRLFYQDKKNTYLIYDSWISNIALNTDEISLYKGTDVSQAGKDLNPMLVEGNPSLLETSTPDSTNINIKALAWLTDTSSNGPWIKYKGPDAQYAIGSSSIELLKASWEATKAIDSTRGFINLSFNNNSSGYSTIANTGTLNKNYNNGIYGKGNVDIWYSSPGISTNRMCFRLNGAVSSGSSFDDGKIDKKQYCIRPIICIPTNLVNKLNSTDQNENYIFVDE